MRGAAVLHSLLLNGIEHAKAGVSSRGENHVGSFLNLSQRQLFSFSRVIPGTVSDTNIVLNNTDVWIDRLRAFFVALFEAMNQTNIHTTEKANRSRFCSFRSEHSYKIRT